MTLLLHERPYADTTILQTLVGVLLQLFLVLGCCTFSIAREARTARNSLSGSSTLGFLAGFSVAGVVELASSGERRLPRVFYAYTSRISMYDGVRGTTSTHETAVKVPLPAIRMIIDH